MTGYVRKDTTNNIADGNVINAADLDAEFDGVQDAFNASTGHNHDGTSGEGAPITALGPTQDVTISAILLAPKTTNTVDIGSSSLRYKDLFLAGNGSIGGTLAVTGVATLTAQPILSSLTASRAVFTDGSKGLVSNAITGTGNVVMSASPTLTGTIDAAAATLSGNLTLSGGTANGVAYLNGSKVVTSGSALTFDGTNLGVGGSASGKLSVDFGNYVGVGARFQFNSSNLPFCINALNNAGDAYIAWNAAAKSGSDTATRVIAAAATKIEGGAGQFIFYNTTSSTAGSDISWSEQMRLTSTGLGIGTSSPSAKIEAYTAGTLNLRLSGSLGGGNTVDFYNYIPAVSNDGFSIAIGGTNRLSMTNAGNLGLGVTPSAWASSTKNIQIPSGSYFATSGQYGFFTSNVYLNASSVETYVANGAAMKYTHAVGQHQWWNAPSGTAGNAITFTQAMTLDASGNLYIGTTTGAERLNVAAGASLSSGAEFGGNGNTIGSASLFVGQSVNGDAYLYQRANQPLIFGTNGTERARIDSSGNLLLGATTGADGKIKVDGTGNINNCAVWAKNSAGASSGTYVCWNAATTGNNKFIDFYTEASPTLVGTITYNRAGGLTAYNTTSDYRAKDILGPVTGSGALIDSVPVYMGKMKGATQERPMFIAHETPEYAHTGEKDAVDADGNPVYQQMDASALIPVMWAEIQSLRKRLADAGL